MYVTTRAFNFVFQNHRHCLINYFRTQSTETKGGPVKASILERLVVQQVETKFFIFIVTLTKDVCWKLQKNKTLIIQFFFFFKSNLCFSFFRHERVLYKRKPKYTMIWQPVVCDICHVFQCCKTNMKVVLYANLTLTKLNCLKKWQGLFILVSFAIS